MDLKVSLLALKRRNRILKTRRQYKWSDGRYGKAAFQFPCILYIRHLRKTLMSRVMISNLHFCLTNLHKTQYATAIRHSS